MTRVIIVVFLCGSCRPADVPPRIDPVADTGLEADADADDSDDDRFARALARIDDIDSGLPRVEGGYVWWGTRDQGRTSHLRRGLVPGDDAEVVLDEVKVLRGILVVDTKECSSVDARNIVDKRPVIGVHFT
jgi:hypothetical protein